MKYLVLILTILLAETGFSEECTQRPDGTFQCRPVNASGQRQADGTTVNPAMIFSSQPVNVVSDSDLGIIEAGEGDQTEQEGLDHRCDRNNWRGMDNYLSGVYMRFLMFGGRYLPGDFGGIREDLEANGFQFTDEEWQEFVDSGEADRIIDEWAEAQEVCFGRWYDSSGGN